ncbi:MAG TPA: SIS domain-containing protein [Armatimonadota bacterium]|nr:SIS domain-containing protein [Armatimonadota bacterium]
MPDAAPGHLMINEIREQPLAISRLIAAELERVWAMAERWHAAPPRMIFIAARGTSDHAALYAKYLFETATEIPVGLAAPSVASVYQADVRYDGALVIGISQSGEAADVISVLERAARNGADTLAITNVADSPLIAAAQQSLILHANPELSVAATKTFTSTLAGLLLLAAAIGRDQALRDHLLAIPRIMLEVLGREGEIRAKVERFRYLEECVVLGRGYNLGTAYELALKLRETSYIRAQPFASPDFVHGPIAIIEAGYPVIAFANDGPTLPTVMQVIEQTQALGAEAVVIGNAASALRAADVAFSVAVGQPVPEVISPFPAILAGQLIAQALSVLKGNDPDAPRGLRKVTITR